MGYTAAVIGTGQPDDPGKDGFAMAYRHAPGYRRLEDVTLTACADIVPENASRFASEFDLDAVFEDYEAMLRAVEPDIVSVCVPPDVHAPIVIGCAESGVVDAIHCEKPMADTWGACQDMVDRCAEADVQLTFNHQYRFGRPYTEAKALLEAGDIGALQRIEWADRDLFDTGTHLFDICGYLTDQAPVEWVLAGLHYAEENVWFGVHNENQAISQWRYADGTHGLAATGWGQELIGCYLRIVGSDGTLEIHKEAPHLRLRRSDTATTKSVDVGPDGVYGPTHRRGTRLIDGTLGRLSDRVSAAVSEPTYTERAIGAVVDALRSGTPSMLAGRNALQATELIFASWESVRRRGRVDLPLEIEDNPLAAMVADGSLSPT